MTPISAILNVLGERNSVTSSKEATGSTQQRGTKVRRIAAAGAIAVIVSTLGLIAPTAAHAEYRGFPGRWCEGYAYTYASTAAMWDNHVMWNYYNNNITDTRTWGPYFSGTPQSHYNYSSIQRTGGAALETTPASHNYVSAGHACDN